MYRIYLFIIYFILSANFTFADEFVVKSFNPDLADLAARSNEKKDINGDICAIIKVHSDIQGLKFDANAGIIDQVVYKEGAYWIYVSPKERQLKIMKEGFITLPYIIPVNIESSIVYVMVLTKLATGVIENINTSGFISLKSTPDQADIEINGEYKGLTPFQMELQEGSYKYKLSKTLYHSVEGSFVITANQTTKEEKILKPNFGSAIITTTPESGAVIEIDNKAISDSTPYTASQLVTGEHLLLVRKKMYEPIETKFVIEQGNITSVNITLTPIFGMITIEAGNNASIFIDGEFRANDKYDGRLIKGLHTIAAKKDKYYTETKKIVIEINKTEIINFDLKPMVGLLSVMTTPDEATIIIDGKNYGTSPQIIKDLLIGEHSLKLEKTGCAILSKTIEIKENEKTILSEILSTGKELTFNSAPQGAIIIINNENIGITPLTVTLSFGSYDIKLTKEDYSDYIETIKIDTEIQSEITLSLSAVINSVIIGSQEWMVENLNVGAFNNDDIIPDMRIYAEWEKAGNEQRPAWCYYEINPFNGKKYGKLYNWYAVNDPRGLCPKGWHVPDDAEWTELTTFLGGESDAGDKLKEIGTTHWKSLNEGATNETGFTALPGGFRTGDGSFDGIGNFGFWWSSTESNAGNALDRYIYDEGSNVYRSGSYKTDGYSVRCLRDY